MTIAILLLSGVAFLAVGGEILVRGASRLALRIGISPLVIGLTVVAFGTSSPELAVSVGSAWKGQSDIALGNVIGSNIFNVLLILGTCAAITPLAVASQLITLDVPVMILVSALCYVVGLDGEVSRIDGVLLFSGLIFYTFVIVRKSRTETARIQEESTREQDKPRLGLNVALIIGGLVLLTLGADLFVQGAVKLARAFGVSELIIGLTIVSAGTSLPEVSASVIAALKKERDIAVGNIIGSNIFNILSVLGLAAVVSPVHVSAVALGFDIPVMIAVAIFCLPVFYVGSTIWRWEGFVFVCYYAAYVSYLLLQATSSANLPTFSTVMLCIVIPLTALTYLVLVTRDVRRRRGS